MAKAAQGARSECLTGMRKVKRVAVPKRQNSTDMKARPSLNAPAVEVNGKELFANVSLRYICLLAIVFRFAHRMHGFGLGHPCCWSRF